MKRRLALLATVAVMLLLAAGYFGVAQAGAASRFGNTFSVLETNDVLIDEATQSAPDFSKPARPGDSIVFKADLLQGKTKVGVGRGQCTSVFDTKYVCTVVFSFMGHGDLDLQVLFDVAAAEGDYAVTGGTGDFAFKHGWAHFTQQSNGDAVHTFHLRSDD